MTGASPVPEPLYYESHITIEPVFGNGLPLFMQLADMYGFRVAELLMKKDRDSTEVRSDKDSFCTSRSKSYDVLERDMNNLVKTLQDFGFKVWRKKIEAVLLDERL